MKGWFNIALIATLVLILFSVGVISLSERPQSLLKSAELASPSDWIQENQIKVYRNKVVLNIEDASWAKFTNTNSMDPFLDENSNAIEILPDNPNDINVGDVISYRTFFGTVIHRVIDKGQDEQGIYYIVKGDNNQQQDLYKIRYENVKGVVVAVIY